MSTYSNPSNVNELMMQIKYPTNRKEILPLLERCFKENFSYAISDDEIETIKKSFGVYNDIIVTNLKNKNILLFGLPENRTKIKNKMWVHVNLYRSEDDPQWKIVPFG